jgi:Carboxypeptidase regulatory-like domain
MKINIFQVFSGLLTAVLFGVIFSGTILAQEITGTINGTVKDSSGGAIAGATVTIIDPSKNDLTVRTLTTGENGEFSAPNLQVGIYQITVEANSFKKAVQTGVKLDVGQRRTTDFSLEAGNISETVTVQADAVSVELTSPTSSSLVSGEQAREISLNNRNFVQLVTLSPGVSSNLADQVYVGNTNPSGQPNTIGISVNGARQSQNTFTIDGADITDRGSNITLQAFPSVDSIGEFKVLRSLYPAESGRSGGGQVNIVTKSGTDSFHGSLFEFVRNEKFNANPFLLNQTTNRGPNGRAIRTPFRYNDYGFTVGGPIYFLRFGERDPSDSMFGKIPKTYFFFSEEARKDRRFPTLSATIPDTAVRQGIFPVDICLSGTISGATRTCNNILRAGTPISSINPTAQAYINNIYLRSPLPNNPNVSPYSLLTPASGKVDFNQQIVKIDTSVTKKLSAFYRYERDQIPSIEANSLNSSGSGIPGVSTSETNSPGRAHTAQLTYVFNPNFILEGRFTYSYGAILSHTTGLMAKSNSSISIPLQYPSTSDAIPYITGIGFSNLQTFGPYDNFSNKKEGATTLTWISGSHTMKFGGNYSLYQKHENALGGTNYGSFSNFFNTLTTAGAASQGTVCAVGTCPTSGQTGILQNFANFLLGNNVRFTQTKYDLTADFRQKNFESFAQDEFRLRSNLTLSYGVRYSFFGSPYDANGLLSNFVPELFDQSRAVSVTGAGVRVAGTGNDCNGLIVNAQNYTRGLDPNCTPIASPYGKFIVKAPKLNLAPRIGLAWDPFGKGTTSIRAGYGIYFDQNLVGTFENHLGANPPYQETTQIDQTNLSNPTGTGTAAAINYNTIPALIRGVQTDYKNPYMQHWSLDVQHQFDSKTIVSVGYYGSKGTHLIGVVDINNLQAGYAATKTCAVGTSTTPTVACQTRDATTGLYVPFTSAASELILDQIRPYRGWRGIFMIQPRFNSNYHSLQVSATRRFTGASQVQLAYTFAKNLTDNQSDRSNAPMDAFNLRAEYGRAVLDRRHVLTINYIYELPFYSKQQGFVGKLLGGWQLSGITNIQTGLPFTPTYSGFDPSGIGFLNASSPAGGRPFVFGDPNNGGAGTQQQFFNISAFQNSTPTLAANVPGNAGRGIINGPGTVRFDVTLAKNIRFGENLRLQLRAEAFNVFNHTNFATLGLTASTLSTFGTVTGTRDPRTLQFGIKFYF